MEATKHQLGSRRRLRPVLSLVLLALGPGALWAGPAFVFEDEPNGTVPTATPLGGRDAAGLGHLSYLGDQDGWSFQAGAGDRIYAALVASSSTGFVADTLLNVHAPGGAILETDDDDGSVSAESSSLAGVVATAAGTYVLGVFQEPGDGENVAARPYQVHLTVRSGSPTPESEPNAPTPQPLPAPGWVSGQVGDEDADYFSFALAAGESVFVSLDSDPNDDGGVPMGLEFGGYGLGANLSFSSQADDGNPSHALVFTAAEAAATYFIRVGPVPQVGTFPYHLSVARRSPDRSDCQTFAAEDLDLPIGPGASTTTVSQIAANANFTLDDLDVELDLQHDFLLDLDVVLVSPQGEQTPLFTDLPLDAATGLVRTRLDDEAAMPITIQPYNLYDYTLFSYQPEESYRLSWLEGQNAFGVWELRITDDANLDGGILNAWRLRLCPRRPACAPVDEPLLYEQDFDGAVLVTWSAEAEWERGTLSGPPIDACPAGKCFKTDLDATYNNNADSDLIGPALDLAAVGDVAVILRWDMAVQMENSAFDHAWVGVRKDFDDSTLQRVWEHLGPSQGQAELGTGWRSYEADISDFAGAADVQVVFHLDSDGSVTYEGMAIDNVSVVTRGLCFHTLAPCRVLDTRVGGDGGPLQNGVERVLDLRNACGLPLTAKAVSANVTAVEPPNPGWLTFYPTTPTLTSNLSFGTATRASNSMLKLDWDGKVRVQSVIPTGGGRVHLVLDVNGYFE